MPPIYYPPLSICSCLFSFSHWRLYQLRYAWRSFQRKEDWIVAIPLVDIQIYWMDWAVLVKARKQEKKHDSENSVWAPGVVLAPQTRPTGRKIVSGHNVLLETGKSQTSNICATLGEIKEGVSTFQSSCEHPKTESQNRKSALQLGTGH